jgi:iron complex transport system ATP-binding protein
MRDDFYFYTENLSVGYHKKPLIGQIEIGLNRGEILTLIGPNGAGKSTILKSITKQLSLISGTVVIDKKNLAAMSEKELAKKLSIVMTGQLKPELMTCEDIVATGRYPYTGRMGILSKEDKRKVDESLALVDAKDLAECDFSEISDGQRQRILLARAICQEPEIIVLDEPTSFLDIRHKLELLTLLKQMVAQKHVAVILSLHEIDLAQKISDKVMCIHNHCVERYGTPEEIFTSEYITSLYGITSGSYYADYGCLELEPVCGTPKVFVIGGGGSGIALYRCLQRQGIPFAAGVLHENDIDLPAARALAGSVITETAYEPIGEAAYARALAVMEQCETVYCTQTHFGVVNQKNVDLKNVALQTGKLQV